VTTVQLLETLTQLHIFYYVSAYFLLHVHTSLNFQTGMNMQKFNYC